MDCRNQNKTAWNRQSASGERVSEHTLKHQQKLTVGLRRPLNVQLYSAISGLVVRSFGRRVGINERDFAPRHRQHEMVDDSPREATERKVMTFQPVQTAPNEISILCMDLGMKSEGWGRGDVRMSLTSFLRRRECLPGRRL